MLKQSKRRLWLTSLMIIGFIFLLVSFRLIWMNYFKQEEQPLAVNGELDLRHWDWSEEKTIDLAGEWSFYPFELIESPEKHKQRNNKTTIQVPGDWSTTLTEDRSNPYGYGTYHLRIYVKAEKKDKYSIQVPSVRSASALYINGQSAGSSGEVGKAETEVDAYNVPYTSSTIRPQEDGVIDVVVQASNFIDPRASGLIRTMKFGYETAIINESYLSSFLQIMTGTIFFVFSLFIFMMFFIGNLDKRLLYFSLALLLVALISVTGGDEKVLLKLMKLEYASSMKLSTITLFTLAWLILQLVGERLQTLSKRILPVVTTIYALSILIIIVLPVKYLANISNIIFGVLFLATFIAIALLLYAKTTYTNSLLIILAIIAIINHFFWWAWSMGTGNQVVYYPFDFIIALFAFTIMWFKHYFELYKNKAQLTDRLQQIDQMKDEFLASTSHELRNPLHSILNLSESILVREKDALSAASREDLRIMSTVSKRMSYMVDELLDMTVLQENTVDLQEQPLSLRPIVSVVIHLLKYMIGSKPVQIINRISEDSPQVIGDENRIIQVLFNLLHNAIKFTHEGKIVINAEAKGSKVLISIQDTGVGIDEETLKILFEPYIQGRNYTKLSEEGFGLGLYISKLLIELHGGSIDVTSVEGEGTTFTFTLPMLDKNKGKLATISSENKPSIESDMREITHFVEEQYEAEIALDKEDLSKDWPRIIAVDDELVNLRVIESLLEGEPYELTTVLRAEEVLQRLDEQEWDLVIADVMMPKMSGYDLTKAIRKRFSLSELPILLLTARDGDQYVQEGFLVGANDYVVKPINRIELLVRIKALTEVRHSARERLRLESAWLQAQIQPHFLFNTINSILALSNIDIEQTQSLLEAFSEVLRGKFNFANLHSVVPIEDELRLLRAYLYIEKARFGERLTVHWDVDEHINVVIPTLSIQPLVENAINHGLMARQEGGILFISIKKHSSAIRIKVEDDGVGMDEKLLDKIIEKKQHNERGVGLINIDLRLTRLYGKGLTIDSTQNKGTTIMFDVPFGS